MTFATALALFIALLALGPVVAHLRSRGRAEVVPFAPARLVPGLEHSTAKRKSVSDKWLLVVRASLILALSLLGASPMLKCDRKLLDRTRGASVARVLLLDDSGSMRSELSPGKSRFELSRKAALSLVEQMRPGDSLGIVLGSKPARVLLAPSSSPKTLRDTLLALQETDRPTELAEAIALSNSVLARQPQTDKKVLLFSDLSEPSLSPSPNVVVMMPELAQPQSDCALLTARRRHRTLSIEFVCTTPLPNQPRTLQLVTARSDSGALAEKPFAPAPRGELVFELGHEAGADKGSLRRAEWVRLEGTDSNPANDATPVITEDYGLVVGIYTDPVEGQLSTGGPPILEQALRAIQPSLELRSLSTVPDEPKSLADISLLILDDPPLFSAETRSAVSEFVRQGNTAVALFGPAASAAELGTLPLPFLEQPATWQNDVPRGLDPKSINAVLIGASSLEELGAKGRLVFDESHDPRVTVRARWSDKVPFWLERPLGRGTLVVFGLPSNVALSDWALRPGYLALLEHLLAEHDRRGRSRAIVVGNVWRFANSEQAKVDGPGGPLLAANDSTARVAEETVIRPDRVGRYQVRRGPQVEPRIATWPATETTDQPRPWPADGTSRASQTTGHLELSRYIVFGILGLLVGEMLLRFAPLKGSSRWLKSAIIARLLTPRKRQSR